MSPGGRPPQAEATRHGTIPIDLIDGYKLCDLLKEFGLGVATTVRKVEEVRVESEFFTDLDIAPPSGTSGASNWPARGARRPGGAPWAVHVRTQVSRFSPFLLITIRAAVERTVPFGLYC